MEKRDDHYWENGYMVFTAAYHLKRGYCCENGCRHCPYGFKKGGVRQKVSISWSGGKDSAFALHKVLSTQSYDVVNLHTVIDEKTRRVGLHGIAEALVERQSEALGIPLEKVYLPASDEHNVYASVMQEYYQRCATQGIDGVVFGDIFLQDLREYRIRLLERSGLFCAFPLWGLDSKFIINDFIDVGFKTIICAADASLFSQEQLGEIIDERFVQSLSSHIDACGENGEFHTFVYDGPLFRMQIPITKGEVVRKTYSYQKLGSDGELEKIETAFWFQDLLG